MKSFVGVGVRRIFTMLNISIEQAGIFVTNKSFVIWPSSFFSSKI